MTAEPRLCVDQLKPDGRRARILRLLRQRPQSLGDLIRAYPAEEGARRKIERIRIGHAVRDMRRAGWITRWEDALTLTLGGLQALETLDLRQEHRDAA